MAKTGPHQRPLSPFMLGTHYRLQLTSVTSFLTRITGNALIVAYVLGVWWLLAASGGPDSFGGIDGFVTSWFGDLVFALSCLALWYHFLAGIRHLIWDTGRALDVPTAEKLGWACIIGSVVLTVLTILIV